MAAPQEEGGPDDSSIKPVSSLLSHFENMGKAGEQPQPAPLQIAQPTGRTVSSAPKPDNPREPNTISKEPPPVPKNKPGLAPHSVKENGLSHPPARSVLSAPPLAPRPIPAPSLTVDPPQSPPKGRSLNIAVNDQPRFLHSDDAVKPAPSPAVPGKQLIRTSAPRPPALDPRNSPKVAVFKPPSPPPPRRSAELRRQRDPDTPPPIHRSEKPLIRSRKSWLADGSLDAKANIAEKVSPFSSPPSSGSASVDDESPPSLPRRPRRSKEPLAKAKTLQFGAEPPQNSLSNAGKMRDLEPDVNKPVRGHITPNLTGDLPPTLPTRPKSMVVEHVSIPSEKIPPPRPPRPAAARPTSAYIPSTSQKRTVSTPLTQPPPPQQGSMAGRSNTVSHRGADGAQRNPRQSAIISSAVEPRPTDSSSVATVRPAESSGVVNTAYPDTSNLNRRPPYIKHGQHEIITKSDPRNFDICGDLVCASGHLTKVWSLRDGELLMQIPLGEGLKATSVIFKPGYNVDEEGKRLWVGTSNGDLIEVDIATRAALCTKTGAHQRNEVIKLYRHFNELWSLDDSGTLNVWGPGPDAVPDLSGHPHQTFRVPRGHTFSMVVGDQLWHATGREIRVFIPTLDGKTQFQVLLRALFQESAGDITSGTILPSQPGKVFFGHSDGKVSVYSQKDYSCLEVLNVSTFKINSLQGTCGDIWAGYSNGRMCVYDVSQSPWAIKKEWQAHKDPVLKLIADRSSSYKVERHQVLSLGGDNAIRVWDGMLQEDWLETEMKAKDVEYCEFDTLKAVIMTWNAGASTPNSLRYSESDSVFIQNLLHSSNSPDILIFGFQELVDLEDKTATAKRLFKSKKKESDQERMSHQYRDWRDFLIRCLDDYMAGDLYHLLQTAHMVGLFTCVFVKADVRDRISSLSTAEVKRGMGGLHGNKGAIIIRFKIDDTSLCFFNCHLAAGQSQVQSRNNDITAILEAQILPPERDPSIRIDSFTGGGDGSMILDHELVILNGDLNYRIDTMSRDTVVIAVKQGNLPKLLDRDQLLVARRRRPDFKLRAFEEMPITFAPTYKYDVGTDDYDSSEKKRSPAWCDRLLYRGGGRIEQVEYRRHEVRVSDHRPVTGKFRLTVKRVSPKRRAVAWMECQQRFEDVKAQWIMQEQVYYLTQVIGYDMEVSQGLISDR
ncbi:hypothetical protein VPNG_05705 [Cytospora leucostoma]|uniref:Inositol polyphosphate-related phosphatase domain-containing protein n=1 Tax=Cytospora leucostoma TaxID=1230097 RepID=A0A423X046_9PEZI|nr:hypothetical protein VPNG_05705 [Cytospora leucostoma]